MLLSLYVLVFQHVHCEYPDMSTYNLLLTVISALDGVAPMFVSIEYCLSIYRILWCRFIFESTRRSSRPSALWIVICYYLRLTIHLSRNDHWLQSQLLKIYKILLLRFEPATPRSSNTSPPSSPLGHDSLKDHPYEMNSSLLLNSNMRKRKI